MSEHQAVCVQLLRQCSILKIERRMHNNIMSATDKTERRYWESKCASEDLTKTISRMTKIIKGK